MSAESKRQRETEDSNSLTVQPNESMDTKNTKY